LFFAAGGVTNFAFLLARRSGTKKKEKKRMAQAFDPLGGGGGPRKKKSTVVKESAQISEITEEDDDAMMNDPLSAENIGRGGGGFTWKHDTRMCIYAPYIDKNKTVKQGRKLRKELCCDRPFPFEIKEAIEKGMNLPCELEDKCYSRDFWERGRVRVEYKNEDGTPKNPEFPTRRSILIECARLVPMHWGRTDGSSAKLMKSPEDIFDLYLADLAKQGGAPGTGKSAKSGALPDGGDTKPKNKVSSKGKKGKKGRK
jgi:signal recognition particle subunit SRP19